MGDLVQELKQGQLPGSVQWRAARRIEELEAGCCRRNCAKGEKVFIAGYEIGYNCGGDWIVNGYPPREPKQVYQEWKDDK